MARFGKYAPEFRIEINGERLPAALRAAVESVTYEDGLEGANSVDVAFSNQNLRLLNHSLIEADNELVLSLGYAGDPLEQVFAGRITGIEPAFPQGGMPTLQVTAHDRLQQISQGARDRSFHISIPSLQNTPLPDSVVTAMVSASNSLIPTADPVGGALSAIMTLATYIVAPRLAQMGIRRQKSESDFEFLSGVARENGWEVFIDHTAQPAGSALRFKSLFDDFAHALSFDYGSTLIDFSPRLSTVGDIDGVAVKLWIDTVKMEFAIVVSWDFESRSFDFRVIPGFRGDVAELIGGGGRTIAIKPVGFPQSIRQLLTELLPRLNNRQAGSGTVVGDPRVRAGEIMNLQSVGDAFGGLYRIKSATHTLDDTGYQTAFEVRKEVWFPSVPALTRAAALTTN